MLSLYTIINVAYENTEFAATLAGVGGHFSRRIVDILFNFFRKSCQEQKDCVDYKV